MGKCLNFLLVVCIIILYMDYTVASDPRPFAAYTPHSDGGQLPQSIPDVRKVVPAPQEPQPKMRPAMRTVMPKHNYTHSRVPDYDPSAFPSGPRQFDYAEVFPDLPVSSPGRWLHSGVVIGNKFLVYGGISAYTDKLYNDLWVYDYRMSSWSQLQRSYIPPLPPGNMRPKDIPLPPSYKRMPKDFALEKPTVSVHELPYQPVFDGVGFASKTANADSDFASFLEYDVHAIPQTRGPAKTLQIDPKHVYPQLYARRDARKELLRQRFAELYKIQKRQNNPSFNKDQQPEHDWPAVPNDLWEYDLDIKTWKCVVPLVEGNVYKEDALPTTRWLHTAVNIADTMVVFGGASNEKKILGDLWMYDPNHASWVQTHPKANSYLPLPRQGHCAVAVGTTMFIFGGISYGYQPFNDLWAYDAINNEWKELSPNNPNVGIAPRWLHSCTAVVDDDSTVRLFVFGGVNKEYVPMNDLNVFAVKDGAWFPANIADGHPPPPRMLHSVVHMGSRLFVYGGLANNIPYDDLHYYDLNTNTWSETLPVGAYPFARAGASVAVVEPQSAATPDRPIYPEFKMTNRPNERWTPRYRKIWNQNRFLVVFGGVGTVQL